MGISRLASVLALLLSLPACDKTPTPAEPTADAKQQGSSADLPAGSVAARPFEIAQAFFELNTTDHDMGFQVFLDAEGWQHVNLTDPEGNTVFGIHAQQGLAQIGITERRAQSIVSELAEAGSPSCTSRVRSRRRRNSGPGSPRAGIPCEGGPWRERRWSVRST